MMALADAATAAEASEMRRWLMPTALRKSQITALADAKTIH